jgi:hypothetical protein
MDTLDECPELVRQVTILRELSGHIFAWENLQILQ